MTDPAPPPLDGRDYRGLLTEALARIPVHTPEWTNRNDADPGVTLLQLWAYLAESVVYRASLVPERNRQAFLRLVGYRRAPAEAATGMVTFEHRSGPLTPHVLPPGTEVAAGAVPFRTDNGLAVLPVETKVYLKRRSELAADDLAEVEQNYAALESFLPPGTEPAYYETTEVDWSLAGSDPVDLSTTVDGTAWLALLARPGDPLGAVRQALGHRTLTLGVVPDVDVETRVLLPAGAPRPPGPGLEFALPNVAAPLPEDPAGRVATYRPVPATASGDLTAAAGVVQLELPGPGLLGLWTLDPTEDGVGAFPPALEGTDAERVVTWLRVRPAGEQGEVGRLRWLGANAAMVRQRAHVPHEVLGRGTGGADQRVTLTSPPVLVHSLILSVGGRPWERVEDLATAGPEVPVVHGAAAELADRTERVEVYTVDRHTGEVRFGDGIHGRRPPTGSVISATYDHGGGVRGVVAAGAVSKGPGLPTGVAVRNPVPTWGGAEAETVEAAERQVGAHVRHRDRLVTEQDVVDIARRTPGVHLGRVELLPLFHPELPDVASPGVLTVLLVPSFDARTPATPEPDRHVLDAVCAHLEPRRLVTTELHVHGPRYVPVWLSVGFDPVPGRDIAVVRQALTEALHGFFSPLHGGRDGTGWPLATDVERLEGWTVAARAQGVAKVTGVLLGGADGVGVDRVPMRGLELPRLTVSVRPGPPQPLAVLLGAVPETAPAVLPVPVVPPEC